MKISKEEIEQAALNHAIITNGSDDVNSYRHAGSAVDFTAGAEWMYQRLEPLITDLSMYKARRQSNIEQKVKEAVKIALQTAAEKALLHIARSPMGEDQIKKAYQDYSMRNDVTVYKQSILSLEQEVLEKLNVKS